MSVNLSVFFNLRLIREGSFVLLAAVLIVGCGSNPPKDRIIYVKFLKKIAAGIRHP